VRRRTSSQHSGTDAGRSDDQICRPSALKPLTAYRWFSEYGKRPDSGWVNTITRAQPATPVAWHAGLCPKYVSCPTLFVVAPEDEMPGSFPVVARRAFDDLAGPKQWLDIAGGHFGLLYFPSDEFERAACAEARFLTESLLTGNSPELLSVFAGARPRLAFLARNLRDPAHSDSTTGRRSTLGQAPVGPCSPVLCRPARAPEIVTPETLVR
jgi:hypothetical protein